MPEKRLTLAQLRERTEYWLDRLSMGEWQGRVVVLFRPAKFINSLTGLDAVAACQWSAEECRAEIYLRRGSGTEENLLHEIGHILWQGHDTYSHHDVAVERAINRMVAGLLHESR